MFRRFFAFCPVVIRAAGRPAFQRAAPFYLALTVAAAVIFSPQGLRAADVTRLTKASVAFRLCLGALWLLFTTPAARTVLCEPSLFVLRALPIPRWHFFLAQGLLLSILEMPWMMLFARGDGVLAGLAAGLMAMAAHTLLIARLDRPIAWATGAGLLGLALFPPTPFFHLILSILACRIGISLAFSHAPERDASHGKPLLRGPALLALCLSYLLTLWRSHGALLGRAVFLTFLGSAVAILALRNNQIFENEVRCTVSLGILYAPLLLGACGLSGPVLRSERQSRFLIEVCSVGGGMRVLAAALAVALFSSLMGGVNALLIGWLLDGSSALLIRLAGGVMVSGAALGAVASCCVRWAQRGDKKDTDRVFVAMLLCIIGGAVLTWLLHELVIGVFVLVALLMLERAASAATPKGRWLRLRKERQQGDLL